MMEPTRTFRDDYLGLWVGRNGKTLYVERAAEDDRAYPLRATLTPELGGAPYPASDVRQARARTFQLKARWLSRLGDHFPHRLDRLDVEADEHLGRVCSFYFSVERQQGAAEGAPLQWRPVRPDDGLGAVRLHDEVAPGLLDGLFEMEDEGHIPWVADHTIFRKASAEELARYMACHACF